MKSQLPNLKPLLFSQVAVEVKGSAVFEGWLIGYDAFYNLTLNRAASDEQSLSKIMVIRGQTIEGIRRK